MHLDRPLRLRWANGLLAAAAALYCLHCATPPNLADDLPTSPDYAPTAPSAPADDTMEVEPSSGSQLEPSPGADAAAPDATAVDAGKSDAAARSTDAGDASTGNPCNTCSLYATRCVAGMARSRQICVPGSNGCTVWTTAQSCSPSETCVAGACN